MRAAPKFPRIAACATDAAPGVIFERRAHTHDRSPRETLAVQQRPRQRSLEAQTTTMQAPAVRRQACLNAPRHRARSPLTQAPARRQDPHHPAPDATRTRTRTPPGPPRGLRSALTSSGEGQHAPRVAEGPLAAGGREGGEARLSPSVTRDARPAARRGACRPDSGAHPMYLRRHLPSRRVATLQKMRNPTGAACAAAPRSLQTLARAGSRRAASGRSLTTLGQSFSS